jgi:hypothetical protein
MKNSLYSVFLMTTLLACQIKKMDTTQIKKEMKTHEIKRISEGHITAFATDWAREITEAIGKGTFDSSLIPVLQKDYEVQIEKIAFQDTTRTMEPKEKQLWAAAKYAVEHKLEMPYTAQKINNGENLLFYTRPQNTEKELLRIVFSKKGIINRVSVKEIKQKAKI